MMRIIVLNGSPKGSESITYHNVLYLEKHFEDSEFEYLNVGKLINKYERDLDYFTATMERIKTFDLILWIYPVYTFSVPYQLMKFIELIISRKYEYVFIHKYTTQLSTSKHCLDVHAYNYLQAILEGFNMRHIRGHMSDMNDLLNEKGRQQLIEFFEAVEDTVSKIRYVNTTYKPYKQAINPFVYDRLNIHYDNTEKTPSNIVIIYNGMHYGKSVENMITYLEDNCKFLLHKVDLSNSNIKGGCLGCLKCAISGHCIYKDDFEKIYQEKVKTADLIIYASDINNHWIDSEFKKFNDRTFSYGHRIRTKKIGVAYLLSGHLRLESNLRNVFEARADINGRYMLDIITDEDEDTSKKLDALIEKIDYYLLFRPERPRSFYGIAGFKIFRDLVYENKGIMVEDHKFYKREKLYDFPKRRILLNLMIKLPIAFTKIPKLSNIISSKLNKHLLSMYKKTIKKS